MIAQHQTPAAYLESYILERGLRTNSAKFIGAQLRNFERHLQRPAMWADFTRDTINRLLAARLETLDPETVRNLRTSLLGLWRAAYDDGLVPELPHRIRKVKVPQKIPRAWTHRDLRRVLSEAAKLEGRMIRGRYCTRAQFWKAFILVAYFSGLRRGDLLALRWDQVSDRGVITITMSKTGDVLQATLPRDVRLALEKLRPRKLWAARHLVFGSFVNQYNAMRYFRKLTKAAGVRGSIKTLRKTGASHVESVTPGAAKAFLGHRSHGLSYRCYVDPNIVQARKPMPPTIGGGA